MRHRAGLEHRSAEGSGVTRLFGVVSLNFIIALYGAYAQAGAPRAFDVASVKASAPDSIGFSVGRGPTRVDYVNLDLRHLLLEAFDIKDFQLKGPGWISNSNLSGGAGKYVVRATYPIGTSPQQVRVMLQNLLIERFQMNFHVEKTKTAVYGLMVDGGRPTLKNADPQGIGGILQGRAGHLEGTHATMKDVARLLSLQMDRPVVDMTGIKGTSDIKLDWSSQDRGAAVHDDEALGQSIFSVLRQELGLRLVPQEVEIDAIVIDHIERVPLEN